MILRVRNVRLGLLGCLALFLAFGCAGNADSPQESTQEEGTATHTNSSSTHPNIVFILTDDLDYDSAQLLPTVRSELIDKGTSFENAFISDSLCCPSRSTILTGLYAHNHGVKSNNPPNGGFPKFASEGLEQDTIATRLQQSGYETGLFGKYLNHYPGNDTTHVPPGWDDWQAWGDTWGESEGEKKNAKKGNTEASSEGGEGGEGESGAEYYGYRLNENGKSVSYGNSTGDYITDVLSSKATDFVQRAASDSKPFFLYFAPTAPHGPPVAAERHQGAFAGEEAPRPPSFDEEDVSDKPPWIGDMSRFSSKDEANIDELYRERLESMLAVDDMVGSLIKELEAEGQLENTFIFFASDNGYLLGQHRIQDDKRYPYEESVRTPLFVRGPGVSAGSKIENLVVNTDFAPTFAELAGTSSPPGDGRSFVPLLQGQDPSSWRSAVLLESFGQNNKKRDLPAYEAIRTETQKYVEYATEDKELYDLQADPHELDNAYESADSSEIADLKRRLDALKSCAGEGCQEAEDES